MIDFPTQYHYYRQELTAHIDWPLLIIALILMLFGLVTIHSATMDSTHRMASQAGNMMFALLVMWGVSRVAPYKMMNYAVFLYIIGILLLLAVLFFGVTVNGAKRWLSLFGLTRIQPAEILKIAVPLMLARFFHEHEQNLNWRHHLIAVGLLLLPFLLIAKQPDLGTALLVGSVGFFVIFFAGLPWKVIFGLVLAGAGAAPVLWKFLHDYQQRRILTLLDPSSDPLGAGYHIIQSTIAIGSGGTFGKGYLNGTQTHLEFIPEKHTDFIFAVYSEEWGLLGNGILLVLYFALVVRGMMIAANAPSLFSRLLAASITLGLFSYAFINMGMVSGILPVVGVPLPFVSYGGTALITLLTGIGMLMSIQTHRSSAKK